MKEEYESLAKKLFADEYEEYVNSLNKEPIRGFVVNTSRVKMEQFDKMCTFNVTKLPFGDACYTLNDNVALIGTPIYDMGLIYKIDQKDNGDLYIEMTLTAPTCPIAGVIPQQVADTLASMQGIGKVGVRLVWEPAWTPDKLSDDAKELMELI